MNDLVHVWVPELSSATGGIQTFSRHLVEALKTTLSASGIRILAKNDGPGATFSSNDTFQVSASGQWPYPFRTPSFVVQCLWWAARERPKLIISSHLNFGPLAEVARGLTNASYVLVAHGIDAWCLKDGARTRALRKADLVLAVSRYTQDFLINAIDVKPANVKVLPNTFSPDRFSIKTKPSILQRKYGLTPDTPVILTVCRLTGSERYKGYDQIIRALPQILRAIPGARYLLVGSGPDRQRIESLVRQVGVRDAVIFAGFVSDEDLCDHYSLCDVFAMPSKAEGFGIVYLEALACGKPVIAGNQDGSRDALADGELGFLVNPEDVNEIASSIISILKHDHRHPNISRPEFLRQRVTELFGFETFKDTLTERIRPFFPLRTELSTVFSKPYSGV